MNMKQLYFFGGKCGGVRAPVRMPERRYRDGYCRISCAYSGARGQDPADIVSGDSKVVSSYELQKSLNDLHTARASLAQAEAEAAFRQSILDAGIEVNDAVFAIKTASEKSANYAAQVASLEEAVESTVMLMQNRSTTYLEVLTARQTLLEAQIGEVANRLSEISGTITLYKTLGGGAM